MALLAGIISVMLYYFWCKVQTTFYRVAMLVFTLSVFLILLNQMLYTYGFVAAFKEGEIIYRITNVAHKDYARWLLIQPPPDLYIPNEDLPAIIKMGELMSRNPIYAMRLTITKAFFFLAYARPYYSTLHNLTALAFLIPVYIAFIKSLRNEKITFPLRLFAAIYVTMSILSPALLTVNWNSRFLVVMLPVVLVMSAGPIYNWITKYRRMIISLTTKLQLVQKIPRLLDSIRTGRNREKRTNLPSQHVVPYREVLQTDRHFSERQPRVLKPKTGY
ncbi:hypothetical protein [Lunatimonas salinarum]|uniref:hypothetical protein n=1 Tax=Lunatimonas salinarum TaxID=1774590 RepID=UPI001ADF7126|nr:hypothetical protein [Lunatimonas salinarum]